jgi:hypothetical protein
MLDQNGFVVLGGAEAYELTGTYLGTYPCFISADAVLYVFHCLFRGGLTDYEKERLVPLTERLVATGLQAAERDWRRRREDPVLAEPACRNLIFFGVASALLGQPLPHEVRSEVEALVKKVLAAREAGFYPDEDFTTYRPRGTYAEDAALARYFRTMRWLSRQILPVVPGHLDRPQEADIKLRQALLLGRWLSSHSSFRRTWKKLYDEIGFFIARPDSFTPLELVAVADRLHLTGFDELALLCRNLEKIAQAEVAGEDWHDKLEGLSDLYIYSFGQWLLSNFSRHVSQERPCVVADVAADSNFPYPVLHEATGPFNYVVIEYEGKDTLEKLYRGWVFSYYEFTRDEFERLTDEQWEDLVRRGQHRPYRPSWMRSFVYGG